MIIPIRCFTCGNVIASKYRKFQQLVEEERKKQNLDKTVIISADNIASGDIKETPEKFAMDALQLKRYCCRRHFISQVDIIKYL